MLSLWRRLSAALWLSLAVATACVLVAEPVLAQEDPPGRVGRIADLQGPVQWFDHALGRWQDATRNLPVTTGDRIATGRLGRAEVRVGSTTLRLDVRTELDVVRLDDERIVVQLHKGSLALRVRSGDVADDIEVLTAEARLRPLRSGHFRIDRMDETTQLGSWRGAMRVDDAFGVTVFVGQRADLWRDGPGSVLRVDWAAPVSDAFAARVQQENERDGERDERIATSRWVSPEMTGAEDLELAGRWDTHPEYGAVWFPQQVRADWAPYRFGRWAWVRPWGWTWVDDSPWGFAPFHYGRWVQWRDRWCWAPGGYVARPAYAPALVAWTGGGNGWTSSVRVGNAPPAWQPLAPRDAYVPWYRHTPAHRNRVNEPQWARAWVPQGGQAPQQQPWVQPAPIQTRPWPRGSQPQQPQAHAQPPAVAAPLPIQTSPLPADRAQPIDDRRQRGWRTPDVGDEQHHRQRPPMAGQPPAMPAPAAPVAPVAPVAPAAPIAVPGLPAQQRAGRPVPPAGTPPATGAPIQVRPPRDEERKRIPGFRGRNPEEVREHQR